MHIVTDAIVLQTLSYSNSSLIARLYTREQGQVSVMAKGARRAQNPTGALLEPLNILQVSYAFRENRSIQTLTEASAQQVFPRIRENMSKLTLSLAMAEILDKTSQNLDPNPILYRLITEVIRQMNEPEDIHWQLFWFFLMQLAIRSGFKPDVSRCHLCDSPLTQGVLHTGTGMLGCTECMGDGDIRLNIKQLQVLRKLQKIHLADSGQIHTNPPEQQGVTLFLLKFLQYHMDGMEKVKSLKMLDKLVK
jgi:DNA repair protein RecO (recombination protein O)